MWRGAPARCGARARRRGPGPSGGEAWGRSGRRLGSGRPRPEAGRRLLGSDLSPRAGASPALLRGRRASSLGGDPRETATVRLAPRRRFADRLGTGTASASSLWREIDWMMRLLASVRRAGHGPRWPGPGAPQISSAPAFRLVGLQASSAPAGRRCETWPGAADQGGVCRRDRATRLVPEVGAARTDGPRCRLAAKRVPFLSAHFLRRGPEGVCAAVPRRPGP